MRASRSTKSAPRESGLRPPKISPRSARWAALALLWIGTFAGIAYGLHRLNAFAEEVDADASWAGKLQWTGAVPEWVALEAADTAGLSEDGDLRKMKIADPQLCEAVAAGMQKSPWVAKVDRVTKQPGRVNIRATYRAFLTYVVHDGKGYLVDEEGFRLPREETESRLSRYEMILLEGVQEPPPPYGEAWKSDAVKSGLKLVKLLQRHCPQGPRGWIIAVDVSNYGRKNTQDSWLSIRTIQARTRILWGYPPGQEYDTEPPAERKLAYLQKAFSMYGGQFPESMIFDLRSRDELLTYKAP